MDLRTYQYKAMTTAEPRAYDHAYLVPGIVGEVGELFGQQAKAYWHGWSTADLQVQLVKEYGDIAWMTAVLLYTEGVEQLEVPANFSPGWGGQKPEPMALLHSSAAQVHSAYLNRPHYDWMQEAAQRLWIVLATQCLTITGAPFDWALGVNLEKLASRAARGVLQGAGDDR